MLIDMLNVTRGGLITKPGVALEIAQAILEDIYPGEVAPQAPFEAADHGDAWEVVGRGGVRPRDGQAVSPMRMVIAKRDGQVRAIDYGLMMKDPRHR